MACGYDLETCAGQHQSGKPLYLRVTKVAPAKDGLPGRSVQWSHGTCPVCGRADKLSMSIKSKQFSYYCHACQDRSAIWQAKVRALISATLPDCIAPGRKPKAETFTRDDFEQLLGLSDAAMRLRAACIAWQMTPKQAAAKLGMSRSSYYRVVTEIPDLGRNRRSA